MKHLAVLFLAVAADPAGAQEPPAAPASAAVDELSRKTLEQWAQKEYAPNRIGVGKGSFTLKVAIEGERGNRAGQATYAWDTAGGGTSRLAWNDASLGALLEREGWSQDDLDRRFLPDRFELQYRGCSLAATRAGETTRIDVTGATKSGLKRFEFDEMGLLRKLVFSVPTDGGEMQFSIAFDYQRVGERYLNTRSVFEMNSAWGAIRSEATLAYKPHGEVMLLDEIRESSTYNGKPSEKRVMRFEDWKIE